METDHQTTPTLESLPRILENDLCVKVAGLDADGLLRGKLVSKEKFLSIARDGFGFCSIAFGWDMHDQPYFRELLISNKHNGYRDLLARVDLASYRRIPWEGDVPLFLVTFLDPDTKEPVAACPRGLLHSVQQRLVPLGAKAMAGLEYEFYHFRSPKLADTNVVNSAGITSFLKHNAVENLPSLTDGMFGYSLLRPLQNRDYYYDVFNQCRSFDCGIESWHTETGPGVFEAALSYGTADGMADKAALFKYAVKAIGAQHGITPCFMAKPRHGLPGNSGHIHISLADAHGRNLFARDTPDPSPPYADVAHLSDVGRHFLAGLLSGLPDVMPLFAPTINSYKRLVENFWAPVTVSWGLEHRAASIRLIAPSPAAAATTANGTVSSSATRLEVRVPGADANPHYALAAIVALGARGVEKKLPIPCPPLARGEDVGGAADQGQRLAKDLKAATAAFAREGSVAREVLGDGFVEHFAGTREHEVRLYEEAVTDWEVRRYIETV